MSRKTNLIKLTAHPKLKFLFEKLSTEELMMVTEFVHNNNDLSKRQYIDKAIAWLILDDVTTKNHLIMYVIVAQLED